MQIQALGNNQHLAPRNDSYENVARTMSSIELRDLINTERESAGESKVRNDQFIARVQDELGDELGECKKIAHPQSRVRMDSYDLTLDQCMLVGMRESKAVRRTVLKKLQAMEAPRVIATLPDFSNPAAAARAWAEQFELHQAANQALAIAAPKAEFVDKYVESTGLKGFRQTAKLLGANEARFREFLLDKKIMYRMGGEWQAHAPHITAGRFDVKTGTSESGHAFNQTKFTPKGVTWVAGLWAQYKLESA